MKEKMQDKTIKKKKNWIDWKRRQSVDVKKLGLEQKKDINVFGKRREKDQKRRNTMRNS